MPELPDLEYIQKGLSAALNGRAVRHIQIKQPIVVRNLLGRKLDEALPGLLFERVFRHGPFLHFVFTPPAGGASRSDDSSGTQAAQDGVDLVIHPMLAGRFLLQPAPDNKSAASGARAKQGAGLCLRLEFEDRSLDYLDTGATAAIPRYDQQGVPVLDPAFTLAAFLELLERRKRQQTRVFLMDQTNLSAIGNAYADEILFAAGVHPKTFVAQLTAPERERLYQSIVEVLRDGIAAVESAGAGIEVKVRGHMQVRGRRDEPCPRCGATIRRVAVLGHDAFFCPICQPARRELFIDWR
jgi:formamidopyrimidine-DNA glycosylase